MPSLLWKYYYGNHVKVVTIHCKLVTFHFDLKYYKIMIQKMLMVEKFVWYIRVLLLFSVNRKSPQILFNSSEILKVVIQLLYWMNFYHHLLEQENYYGFDEDNNGRRDE